MRRLIGLVPKKKPLTPEQQQLADAIDGVTASLNAFTEKMKARMDALKAMPPPALGTVETQMNFSAAYRRCLEAGMSEEDARHWCRDHAKEIKAGNVNVDTHLALHEKLARLKKKERQMPEVRTTEDAKAFVEGMAEDIEAKRNAPWRTKIAEGHYEGSCGCIFDKDGKLVPGGWCGDHY